MRPLLITADLQIQKGPRFNDIKFALNNMIDFIKKVSYSYINTMVLGDIYERNDIISGSEEEAVFIDWISRISKYGHVYIIPGNHDLIDDNNNVLTSIKLLTDTFSNNIHIIDKPCVIEDDSDPYIFIPYLHKNYVRNAGKSYRDLFLTLLSGLEKQVNGNYHLFTHCDIAEAEPEKGQYLRPDAITIKDLKKFDRMKYCFAGHIHKQQKLGNIYYCGSPIHTTFASGDAPKGFLYYNTKVVKFTELPNRMQLELEYNFEDNLDEFINTKCVGDEIPDAMIKLKLIFRPGEFDHEVANRILEILYHNGAYYVMKVPVKESSNSLINIVTDLTDDESILKNYLEKVNGIHLDDIIKYSEKAIDYLSMR
jgi:DNA repair exonuclease SbcCD nuclease subunit